MSWLTEETVGIKSLLVAVDSNEVVLAATHRWRDRAGWVTIGLCLGCTLVTSRLPRVTEMSRCNRVVACKSWSVEIEGKFPAWAPEQDRTNSVGGVVVLSYCWWRHRWKTWSGFSSKGLSNAQSAHVVVVYPKPNQKPTIARVFYLHNVF